MRQSIRNNFFDTQKYYAIVRVISQLWELLEPTQDAGNKRVGDHFTNGSVIKRKNYGLEGINNYHS